MASKPIVAGTDGSEESLRAVDWAAREAALRGAPLRIVATAGLLPRMRPHTDETQYETVTDVLVDDRDRALAMAAERAAKAAAGVLIDTDELTGPTAQAVTESGAGALMLVLGSRGTGAFAALLLGSVSRYAASHASSPVVVIRDEPPASHGLIGVGVADIDSCRDALTFALEEASLRHASLHAVHAWHTPQTDISRAGQSFTESSAQAAADAAGSWPACSTNAGPSTRTFRSVTRSCTVTRAARWPACPPGRTWWSSAGAPVRRVPARCGTPC